MASWISIPKCGSEPFLYICMITLGANLTLLPLLTVSKLCHNTYNTTVCSNLGSERYKEEESAVYKDAATWNTIIFLSAYIPAVFSILPLGALSDVISRKKVLLLPPFATLLQCIIYICCARFRSVHVGFLAVGASLTSVFGDIQGAVMLSYAYLASVTNNSHNRILRMAFLEGALFLGLGLGSYAAGLILHNYGFVMAFALSLSASLINILFVSLLLPAIPKSAEPQQNQLNFKSRTGICPQFLDHMKKAGVNFIAFTRKYFLPAEGKVLVLLLFAAIFTNSAILGENSMIALSVKHNSLRLPGIEIGSYMYILHTIRGIGISILAVAAQKLIKPCDYAVLTLGLCSLVASHVILAYSTTKPMLYAFPLFSIAFHYTMSRIRAHLTKIVTKDEHGTVLSFVAFTRLFGLNIMVSSANPMFQTTGKAFLGFSTLLSSFASCIALVVFAYLFCISRGTGKSNQQTDEENDESNDRHPLHEWKDDYD